VVTAQIQLLSRVVKLSWLDDPDAHDAIVAEMMDFLKQPSEAHYLVGLKIFNQLVSEMNQQTPGTSLISQRKVAVSFRHSALLIAVPGGVAVFAKPAVGKPRRESQDALKGERYFLNFGVSVVRFRRHFFRRKHGGYRDDPGAVFVAVAHRRTGDDGFTVRRVQVN
jgi:hypothetical protein